MVRRPPYAAGRFYMGNDESLKREIDSCLLSKEKAEVYKIEAKGVVVPHAGYEYSGTVACDIFNKVVLPDLLVIIGPNHTGLGDAFALSKDGSWITPFGEVTINTELAEKILSGSRILKEDKQAHMYEHSIEVQLPLIQYLKKKDFQFVPICIREYQLSDCEDIGRSIASAVRASKKVVLVVASTDFTHYETQLQAEKKDRMAIEDILHMDANALFNTIVSNDISMCGPGPVATMLYACKELGATKAELVKYETSGERTGDFDAVVGYAGIIIK